jgi:VCBS repeat-containing protein
VLALTADGLLYTPDADFFGWDTFTYTATDGQADSNEAEVTLTVTPVNDAPVAFDDAYELPEGTALVISAPQGVLANDTDIEGDPLTAVLREGPAHGTLSLTADGAFTYSPDATYVGMDHFTYAAHDGQAASAPATVTLTVQPANQPPVFTSTPPSVFTLPPAMERGGDAVLYTPEAATLEVTWNRAEARYRNEVGLYRVDDAAGRVNGLLPTDPGYAEAALASGNATVLFARGAKTGTKTRVALTGDAYYGFFLVQDSTLATLRAQNPANQLRQKPLAFFSVTGANPDERDHLQASIEQHTLRLGWEDLTGLGDRDFDDAVLTAKLPARCALTFVQPARAPLPITVICPGTQDDQVLQVPQGSGQPVEAIVTWGPHEANARTDAGIFRVDDPSGRINGLLPADPGYAQAALARAEVLIPGGVPCGTETHLTLEPGAYYAFYLIPTSTSQVFLAKNPTNKPGCNPVAFFSLVAANPDGRDHLHGTVQQGQLRLAWEDRLGGGDQDFDDAVLTLRLRQEAAPAVFTYQAQAMDPDGDALTYTLLDGPTGATLDATTGLLTWAAQLGQYTFVLQVSDGKGGVATQRFTLTVQAAPLPTGGCADRSPAWVDWTRPGDGLPSEWGLSSPDWAPTCMPEFTLAGASPDWVVNMPAPALAG